MSVEVQLRSNVKDFYLKVVAEIFDDDVPYRIYRSCLCECLAYTFLKDTGFWEEDPSYRENRARWEAEYLDNVKAAVSKEYYRRKLGV